MNGSSSSISKSGVLSLSPLFFTNLFLGVAPGTRIIELVSGVERSHHVEVPLDLPKRLISEHKYEEAFTAALQLVWTVLEFGVTAYADEIAIGSLSVKDLNASRDDIPYEGPDFGYLDEKLQSAFHKYLEIRGIKRSTRRIDASAANVDTFGVRVMVLYNLGCITNKSPNTVTAPLLRCTSSSSLLRHLRLSLRFASGCSSPLSTTPPPVSFLSLYISEDAGGFSSALAPALSLAPFSPPALPSPLSCFHSIIPFAQNVQFVTTPEDMGWS
ncbi:hypothetical protein Syun_010353 [Stephania yunnanensis]|uniref:Uncharacterized protein n=1 Tax=Stephania yunnanensis TaxID=152371 RepID=A0AAP0KI60_9MAGN